MALTFYWGITTNSPNLQNLGTTDYSASDSTGNTFGTPTFSTNGLSGSYAIGAAANTQFGYGFQSTSLWTGTFDNTNQASDLVGAFALNVYFATSAPTGSNIRTAGFQLWNGSSSERLDLIVDASNKLALRFTHLGSSTVYNTTTTTLSANQWYGIVGRIDLPNNKTALEIYTHSGAHGAAVTLVESLVDTSSKSGNAPILNTTSGTGTLFQMVGTVHPNDPAYIDNCFVADSYDEPLQNNLTISAYSSYVASSPKRIVPVNFINSQLAIVTGS